MSTSVFQQAIAAAVTKLRLPSLPASALWPSGLTAPAGLTVDPFRTLPVDKAATPILVVYPDVDGQLDRVGTLTAPVSHRLFKIKVDCWTTVPAGQDVFLTADPLLVWAIAAIMSDQTLGGLAASVQHHETEWDVRRGEKLFVVVTLGFVPELYLNAANPTSLY